MGDGLGIEYVKTCRPARDVDSFAIIGDGQGVKMVALPRCVLSGLSLASFEVTEIREPSGFVVGDTLSFAPPWPSQNLRIKKVISTTDGPAGTVKINFGIVGKIKGFDYAA